MKPAPNLVQLTHASTPGGAMVIDIPLRTISEANRASHEHWRVRAKRAKEQRSLAVTLLKSAFGRGAKVAGRAAVTMTRIAPVALDSDNLPMSFKHVRDGVADWLGINDRDPRIRWQYAQGRGAPWQYGVRIAIVPELAAAPLARGIDPGEERYGWGDIEIRGNGVRCLGCGHRAFAGNEARLRAELCDLAARRGVLVVEQIIGEAYPGRGKAALKRTEAQQKAIVAMAEEVGLTTVLLSAREIRDAIAGSQFVSDRRVGHAVSRIVAGVRPLSLWEAPHVNDALAAAVVGYAQHQRLPFGLPEVLRRELEDIAEQEALDRLGQHRPRLPDGVTVVRSP